MSTTTPVVSVPIEKLPEATLPPPSGALALPSRGTLSSDIHSGPSGFIINTLEQAMGVAKYLVDGKAAPKDWTAAQVFLAMQAGMEHGLGYTGGIQSFVIINNMPSWRGQAAVGKIRASRSLEPGTLDFGCEADPDKEGHLRGWAKARRVGDRQDTWRFFTQTEAMEAGLWSAGNNWTKFKRRMLMWRAVGFLTKDLFSDVLGNFPIAEELLFRGIPEDDIDRIPAKAVSQLSGAVDAPASDSLLDELAPRVTVTDSATAAEKTSETVETDPAPPVPAELLEKIEVEPNDKVVSIGSPTAASGENRFRNRLAAMDDAEDFADLERKTYAALTAAGKNKEWEGEVNALAKKLLKKFPKPKDA